MIAAVVRLVGLINLFIGVSMVLPLFCALIYREGDWLAFLLAMAITVAVSLPAVLVLRKRTPGLSRRTGMAVVVFGWITVPLFASLPFLFEGQMGGFTDCFFESVSGFTTTGSSILTDIEKLPHGILLWRSLIQWFGGLGIVLITVAFFSFIGVGGNQLFQAEVPGLTADKIQPRITETARHLWWVYTGLTLLQIILMMLGGVSLFESICHSLTTLATGGFSTRNASAAAFGPYIQWVITFFMFLAGTNFTLHYSMFREGRFRYLKDPEFRFYALLIMAASVAIVAIRYSTGIGAGIEQTVRESVFTTLSILTTTGYANCDYETWQNATWLPSTLLVVLMFIGGMGGSTGGGMKVIRVLLLVKIAYRELYTAIHPSALCRVQIGGRTVSSDLQGTVAGFFFLYMGVTALSTLALTAMGLDLVTALSGVATTLNNIGPGLGTIGPTENFAHLPAAGKWLMCMLMIAGRLEIYTFFVLMIPDFWRR